MYYYYCGYVRRSAFLSFLFVQEMVGSDAELWRGEEKRKEDEERKDAWRGEEH